MSFKSHAIYTHHQIANKQYIDAAKQFHAVVKIYVLDRHGQVIATGSGTWIQNRSGQRFILTASHVLRDGAQYRVMTPQGSFTIHKIEHFEDFILKRYTRDYAITVSDARTHKRMFGIRFNQEPDSQEAMRSYGLDLAVAFVDGLPNLKPYPIAGSIPPTKGMHWAVGYGESGAGGNIGMLGSLLGSLVRYSGVKKAFNPHIQDHYYLTFTHILSGQKQIFTLLGSIFEEKIDKGLEGQVGPGDSGGPLLIKQPDGAIQVRGVICSSLPRIHTRTFKQEDSWWTRLIKRLGQAGDSRTPLSYLLWQESNVYGSEAHYIDLSSPIVQEWIEGLKE